MSDEAPQTWKQKYGPALWKFCLYALTVLMTALATYLGMPAPPPLIVERTVTVTTADEQDVVAAPPDARRAMGWVRDGDAVKAVVTGLPHPRFATTPAAQVQTVPDHVYLWDIARAVGADIPPRDQGSVGSCVSFGSACAVEYCECVAIAAAKKVGLPVPEFKPVAQEVIYGGSRVQVGGGRIRGDGSTGAWAAKWCHDYGSVARGKYGRYDLSNYSERTCRTFGSRGCPSELVPEAKLHPTRSISLVNTTDDARKALASGYPVTVASDVGFGNRGPYVRNAKGQLRESGEWPHQMCFIGYDNRSGFLCMNSWGPDWVSGPTGPGNPPAGSFYVEESTAARMLGQGDSWAYADQVGFPARNADDWFILAPRKRDPFALANDWSLAP